MSKVESRKAYRPNKQILIVCFVSAIALTTFIDPINWPKQITLITAVPWLVWNSFRGIDSLNKVRYFFLFLGSALLSVAAHLLSNLELERKLYGLWSRSNGLLTNISLILIALVFSVNIKKNGFFVSSLITIEYFGVVTALYGVLQKIGLDPVSWSVANQVFGTFGNTNFASAIWALCAMSAISLLFSFSKSSKQKIFHLAATLLLFFVIYCTNSIQGLMALAIFLALYVIVWVKHKSRTLFITSILTLTFTVLMLIPSFFGVGILGDRFEQYTLKLRSLYWLAGVKMGNSNPFLGVGADSYGDYFREYRTLETAKLTSIELITNNAHNTFIQTYATLGIVGLSSILMLFSLAFWKSIKLFFSRKATIEQEIISIIFVVLWALASISIDNIAIAVWNWVFLGFVLGSTTEIQSNSELNILQSKRNKNRGSAIQDLSVGKYIALGICGVCFAFSWASSLSDRQLISTFGTPTFSDNQQSLDRRSADLLDILRNPIVQEGHFLYVARGLIAINRHAEAIATLESGIKRYPRDFALLSLLAQEQTDFGSADDAIRIRQEMVRIDPRHAPSWLSLAYLYAQKNDSEFARFAMTKSQEYRFFLDERGLIALESLTTLINK